MMTTLAAQVVSMVMLALGLSYLLQSRQWLKMSRELMELPHRCLTLGLLMLVFGLVIVFNHNAWLPAWTVAITVFGWIVLLKGATFLLYPQMATWFANWPEKAYLTWIRTGGVVMTVLGAILTYLTCVCPRLR